MTPTLPPITAVISTWNRGEKIVDTIETIRSNHYPHFEVQVIDQSEDDLTEASIQRFLSDSRFCYARTTTCGLSTDATLDQESKK